MTQLNWMAWQEILARIFDGFEMENNVSPDWMTNPATGRLLKLDRLYPEIGLAVRFAGGQAKGRRRRTSDREVEEEEQRDQTRVALCQQVGVTLLLVNPSDPEQSRLLGKLCTALSGASRRLAQSDRPNRVKGRLMPLLSAARQECFAIRGRLRGSRDMALYSELWRDRETREVIEAQAAARVRKPSGKARRYRKGQMVRHQLYGIGTVVGLEPVDGDVQVTVRFGVENERVFLASLVGDKLLPQR